MCSWSSAMSGRTEAGYFGAHDVRIVRTAKRFILRRIAFQLRKQHALAFTADQLDRCRMTHTQREDEVHDLYRVNRRHSSPFVIDHECERLCRFVVDHARHEHLLEDLPRLRVRVDKRIAAIRCTEESWEASVPPISQPLSNGTKHLFRCAFRASLNSDRYSSRIPLCHVKASHPMRASHPSGSRLNVCRPDAKSLAYRVSPRHSSVPRTRPDASTGCRAVPPRHARQMWVRAVGTSKSRSGSQAGDGGPIRFDGLGPM
jgi:hypothetical protein